MPLPPVVLYVSVVPGLRLICTMPEPILKSCSEAQCACVNVDVPGNGFDAGAQLQRARAVFIEALRAGDDGVEA